MSAMRNYPSFLDNDVLWFVGQNVLKIRARAQMKKVLFDLEYDEEYLAWDKNPHGLKDPHHEEKQKEYAMAGGGFSTQLLLIMGGDPFDLEDYEDYNGCLADIPPHKVKTCFTLYQHEIYEFGDGEAGEGRNEDFNNGSIADLICLGWE
jgi:hypothetical protein